MQVRAQMTSTSGWRVGLFNNLVLAQLLHFSTVRKEMHEFVDYFPYKGWQRKEASQRTYHSSWSGTSLADSLSVFFCFILMRHKRHIVFMFRPNIGHIVNECLCLYLNLKRSLSVFCACHYLYMLLQWWWLKIAKHQIMKLRRICTSNHFRLL